MQEAGIKHDPALEQRGPVVEEIGQKAIQVFLNLDPPVEAIFATNNRLTVSALRTLYLRHKRVPDDMALVGFHLIHTCKLCQASIRALITRKDWRQ